MFGIALCWDDFPLAIPDGWSCITYPTIDGRNIRRAEATISSKDIDFLPGEEPVQFPTDGSHHVNWSGFAMNPGEHNIFIRVTTWEPMRHYDFHVTLRADPVEEQKPAPGEHLGPYLREKLETVTKVGETGAAIEWLWKITTGIGVGGIGLWRKLRRNRKGTPADDKDCT